MMKAIITLHSSSGCDTVSAFSGHGKVKPLNLILKHTEYSEAFVEMGKIIEVSNHLQKNI